MSEYAATRENRKPPSIQNIMPRVSLVHPVVVVENTALQPASPQRTAVPTEIFDQDLNVHESSLPQSRHDPVFQQLVSEVSSV